MCPKLPAVRIYTTWPKVSKLLGFIYIVYNNSSRFPLKMDSDSGNEIFLTQTSYCHKSDSSVDTDTIVTDIVNDNANAEWKNYIPNFHIKSDVFSDISEFEGDDECLIMAVNKQNRSECHSKRTSSTKPLRYTNAGGRTENIRR